MRIAIFTMGTRGDVQPYIYLAAKLNEQGCETVIGTHPCWKKLVCDAGISYLPIGPDIDIELETARIRGKTANAILSMMKTMNFVFRMIEHSTKEIYDACKGKDLIIVSHSQMGATEAEALGIPMVNVTLQTEMIPQKLKPQILADRLIGKLISRQICKPYNKIRKKYRLPELKDSGDLLSGTVNLIPISKYVTERNAYWEDKNILTGYWYEEDEHFVPDQKLSDFLEAGDKPIILALGAMSFESTSEKDKLDIFVNAFQKTGKRAIIQGFQKSVADYAFPDTMLPCASVPHSWLFRQGYAVIHHCGFGTSSAAMIYGIPSIPVPHVLDQTGFAGQMEKLGVSTRMIPAKDISEARIVEAISELDRNYDSIYDNVQKLSVKLQNEKGLDHAVRAIGNCNYDNPDRKDGIPCK